MKFKRCHGALARNAREYIRRYRRLPPAAEHKIAKQLAYQERRLALFGHAPIVTAVMNGYRMVGVGQRVHWSKAWKTFPDFLIDWFRKFVGAEWGQSELSKPFERRHPIVQWYDGVCRHKAATIRKPGEVVEVLATGPVAAFLWLAYDLFVLEHRLRVRDILLKRLRNPDQFQGALYEIHVTASLIRAGFDIELEDESDESSTHCELTAIHPRGRRYSVECKSKHRTGVLGRAGEKLDRDAMKLHAGRLLRDALSKVAPHDRIVFIDANMPPDTNPAHVPSWADEMTDAFQAEERRSAAGENLPEAWTVVTNRPSHYAGPEELNPRSWIVFGAFNKSWFQPAADHADFRDPAIGDLFHSLRSHRSVPNEFE